MLRPRLLPALLAAAATLAVPLDVRAQASDTSTTYLKAGRLFDSESATLLGPRVIRVKGRMIEAVDEAMKIPPGARVIDLSRYTVLPGLIDSHTHLLYLEDPEAGSLTGEGTKAVIAEGTPLRALHGAARARTFLDAGITTVRDLGNSGRFGDVALKTAINDGSVPGPRMLVAGPGLSPIGGQFPGLVPDHIRIAEDEYRIVRSPDDAAEGVRENVTLGADVIKIYSNNTPNRGSLSVEEMQAIVATAKRLGVRVAAHATSDDAVYRAAFAGVNSIEHAYQVSDSTLALMAKNHVVMVPTDIDSATFHRLVSNNAQRSGQPAPTAGQVAQYLAPQRGRLTRAIAAGVTIAAGSDNYLNLHMPQGEAARRLLFAYSQAGIPNAKVLQFATWNAAQLLGGRTRIGAIRAGYAADIVAFDGDPVATIAALEKVAFVMANGRVHKAP
ncbi:MAG: amidohydrolase family protein [Gemmatimonadaceae bacterium]|nr:amidohydrolase family protein [Gemmatimonadaceae bacterium]